MQQNLVSIIVPVYNAGKYIEETIRMVEAQTYQDWELLLIDDCSTDNSRAVIEAYIKEREQKLSSEEQKKKEIRLIQRSENGGAARTRNTGIEKAGGRYIAFLDADDIWMPDKLTKEIEFLQKKQAAFAFTSYEFGDEQARGTGKIVHAPEALTYEKALSRTVIFTSTVMIDTEKTGRGLVYMPIVKSEDTALWWKLLKNGFTAYGLDDVLTIYMRPPRSLSSNKLEAIRRIWYLYRKEEKLSLLKSCVCLVLWAYRAARRRM